MEKKNLFSLQYFRGMAALLVVMYHATLFSNGQIKHSFLGNFFDFGYAGVDFFFVLSGFIIFYAHASDIGRKDKFRNFVLKRFVRVYPIYWLITFIILILYFIKPSYGLGNERQLDVIIKSFLLLPQDRLPILNAGWTLVHEVLFYSIFSLAIFLKPKYSFWIISAWILGIFLFTLNFFQLKTFLENPFFNYLFSTYNLEFIFGCIVMYFTSKILNEKFKINIPLTWLLLTSSIILFVSGKYIMPIFSNLYYGRIFIYGISSMLIILSSVLIENKTIIKVHYFLCYLGEASYSIYLTHFMLISIMIKFIFFLKLDHISDGIIDSIKINLIIIVIVLISVVTGCMVHTYIEKPLLKIFRYHLRLNSIDKKA